MAGRGGGCGSVRDRRVGGQGIFDRLKTSEPRVPGSGSEKASVILENAGGGTSISMLVAGVSMTDQALLAKLAPTITTARKDLTDIAHVATVLDPWAVQPPDPRILPYLATDGKGFIVTVTLAEKLSDADDRTADTATTARLRTLGADIVKAVPDASYKVSSNRLITAEINDVMERDLVRAEAVSLPISLIVMVFVFGGLLAAAMPIIGAIASILGGLGLVLVLSYVMKLDAVTVNVVTVLGLGLSIDYGLLTVSRFREELHAVGATPTGGPSRKDPLVQRAVQRTVATAGRTVSFSALTIAISVLGLLAMSPDILRGIGVAAASRGLPVAALGRDAAARGADGVRPPLRTPQPADARPGPEVGTHQARRRLDRPGRVLDAGALGAEARLVRDRRRARDPRRGAVAARRAAAAQHRAWGCCRTTASRPRTSPLSRTRTPISPPPTRTS